MGQMALQRAQQEKANKEHTIHSMNEEIAHQDEAINKLNKEKKHLQENQAKQLEELGAAEEKVDHLNKVKAKLEQTLDELEDSLEREKSQDWMLIRIEERLKAILRLHKSKQAILNGQR